MFGTRASARRNGAGLASGSGVQEQGERISGNGGMNGTNELLRRAEGNGTGGSEGAARVNVGVVDVWMTDDSWLSDPEEGRARMFAV